MGNQFTKALSNDLKLFTKNEDDETPGEDESETVPAEAPSEEPSMPSLPELPPMPEMPGMPEMPPMPEFPPMPEMPPMPPLKFPMPSFKRVQDTYGEVVYSDQHVTVFEKGLEVKYYYHPMSKSRCFFFSDMSSVESGIYREHGWGRETAEDIYWAADYFSSGGPHHIVITFKKEKLGRVGFSVCKVKGDMEKCLGKITSGIANPDGPPPSEEPADEEEPDDEEPDDEEGDTST